MGDATWKGSLLIEIVGQLIDETVEPRPLVNVLRRFLHNWPVTGSLVGEQFFASEATLTAQATTFDFAGGGLLDIFGRALDMAAIHCLLLFNDSTTDRLECSGNLLGPGASSPFPSQTINPFYCFAGSPLIICALRGGWPVTAATQDRFTINSVAATIAYRLLVVGSDTAV